MAMVPLMRCVAVFCAFALLGASAFAALDDPLEFVPKYADRRDARPVVFESAESDPGAVMPHALTAKFEMHRRPGSRYGIDFAGCAGSFQVLLNDRIVCSFSVPPYRCDITAWMRVGENQLVVESLDEYSFLPTAGELLELKAEPRPTTIAEIMSCDRTAISFKPPCVVTGVVAFAHAFINDTAVLVDESDPNGAGMYMSGAMPEEPKSIRVGYDRLSCGDRVEVVGVADPLVVRQGVAAARITMPRSRVRLSAGRAQMPEAVQAMCFLAGANSIFCGDQLLVTPNEADEGDDLRLLAKLGLRTAAPQPAGEL